MNEKKRLAILGDIDEGAVGRAAGPDRKAAGRLRIEAEAGAADDDPGRHKRRAEGSERGGRAAGGARRRFWPKWCSRGS